MIGVNMHRGDTGVASRITPARTDGGQRNMIKTGATKLLCSAVAGLCLAGCGGGEIGGTLSGLGSGLSVTLRNNDADSLTLARNGSFTFANTLGASSAYAVTVLTQPVGQSCAVTNGSGTLNENGDSIDNVNVVCSTTASLVGTLDGLVAGTSVTLVNAGIELALVSDGPFAFPGIVGDGTDYEVTVRRQPLGTECSVTNGRDRFFANVATNLRVTCN
jgi:hypothetical protein